MRHLCRTWDGHNPVLLRHQPGQRELGGCHALAFGPGFHQAHKFQVIGPILRRKPGFDPADITLGKTRSFVDGPAEKTDPERAPRDEANAQFLA
ncbi:hypothetical protein D3C84_1126240 [compost metagenome]